jgi:hypothetical protein
MPKFWEHSDEPHAENFLCARKGPSFQNQSGAMKVASEQVQACEAQEKVVRVYTDLSHCGTEREACANMLEDRDVVPFVRANWNLLTAEERRRRFGARVGVIEPVKAMQQAEVCALPKVWSYYVRTDRVRLAQAFARRAADLGKEVVVWSGGDLEAVVPIPNAVTFFHGPHRSMKRAYGKTFAMPQFKEDSLQLYYQGKEQPRRWKSIPSVGFCGLASSWNFRTLVRAVCTRLHQFYYKAGRARYVPPSLPPPVVQRMKILRILAAEPELQTNFIIRDRYRGGLQGADDKNPQAKEKLEFVGNILENDYTVCVRGSGNFSARLYETLCLGRVPIFVNTDCVLPYDFHINYRDYCVWIEESEIGQLPQRLLDFHSRLSPVAFLDLQHRCRQLWEDYLSGDGFYRHFAEHFGHNNFGLS